MTISGPSQITVRLKGPYSQWEYVPALTAASAIVSKAFVERIRRRSGSPEPE